VILRGKVHILYFQLIGMSRSETLSEMKYCVYHYNVITIDRMSINGLTFELLVWHKCGYIRIVYSIVYRYIRIVQMYCV
jgi:hypothetical protein